MKTALSLVLLLLLASCATPGVEVKPEAGDFAFLEITLAG
jgi:hypothetical protein